MKCKHDGDRISGFSKPTFDPEHPFAEVDECDICQDCGAWLSLGPATITPEVRVEIIGAEWAVNFDRDSMVGGCIFGDAVCDVCQARHLASVIRNHDRDQALATDASKGEPHA